MDGNFAWQEHQVNERIQARLREAEAHRLVKSSERRRPALARRLWTGVAACWRAIAGRWPRHTARAAAEPGETGAREVLV